MSHQNNTTPPLAGLKEYAVRLREFETLEETIEARKQVLTELEHDVQMMDKAVAAKQKLLHDLTIAVQKQETSMERKKHSLDKAISNREAELVDIGAAVEEARKQFDTTELANQVAMIRQQLRELEATLTERKQYQAEQEQLIATMVEEGNLKLKSTEYEINELIAVKKTLEGEVGELTQEKYSLVDEILELQGKIEDLQQEAAEQKTVMQEQRVEAERQLATARAQLQAQTEELDTKLKQLKEKEEGLLAKQTAIRKESEELVTERRRLEGVRSLYET